MKTGWIHAEENNTNVRFAPKTMVSEVLISENGPDLMTALNQMLLEKCYPVGAVYQLECQFVYAWKRIS